MENEMNGKREKTDIGDEPHDKKEDEGNDETNDDTNHESAS
jgi:hypothetical protein